LTHQLVITQIAKIHAITKPPKMNPLINLFLRSRIILDIVCDA